MKAQIEIEHLKSLADNLGLCVLVAWPVEDGLITASEAHVKLVKPEAVAPSVYPIDQDGVYYADTLEDYDKAETYNPALHPA